jgi:predicted nucleotidyltransferase
MIPEIQQHRKEIEALSRRYGVLRLEVFGSAVTGGYRPNSSDLDFLVEFESQSTVGYADRYFGLLEGLEALFKRPVDLVVTSAIRNPYFRQSVQRTKALLYAA